MSVSAEKSQPLACPARPAALEILLSSFSCCLGIGAVSFLSFAHNLPVLMAPFGATAVLIYAVRFSPFAQPRSVLGGHLLSALAGIAAYHWLGATWWSVTLAVAAATVLMLATRTVHPPGGATALVAMTSGQGLSFLLTPVLSGLLIMLAIAFLVNNCGQRRHYPTYWL